VEKEWENQKKAKEFKGFPCKMEAKSSKALNRFSQEKSRRRGFLCK